MMDRIALEAWLAKLHLAWGKGEVDLVPGLFASCTEYWESPFEKIEPSELVSLWEPLRGQIAQVLDFDIWQFDGEKATLKWDFVTAQGHHSNGILLLCFNNQQECTELRMWWMAAPATT